MVSRNSLIILVICSSVLLGSGCKTEGKAPSGDAAQRINIVASFYPLAALAEAVGGSKVTVRNITPPGAEPHDFEPSPRDVASITDADIFIFNGAGFDSWAEKLAAGIDPNELVVMNMSEHVKLRGISDAHDAPPDPHFWLDPVEAQAMVKGISDALIEVDPGNRGYYRNNEERSLLKLKVLDKAFINGMRSCLEDTVVASHASLRYLAERYGFKLVAISGVDPESEPSPKEIAMITNLVREKGISYIFFESLVSPKFAETIASETGAKTLVFDPLEGLSNEQMAQGLDYFSVMEQDLEALKTARSCGAYGTDQ